MRNIKSVIYEMTKNIPLHKKELLSDLKLGVEGTQYAAPELSLTWDEVQQVLIRHIPNPNEDWEFKVLSIFTCKSVYQLRKDFGKPKKPKLNTYKFRAESLTDALYFYGASKSIHGRLITNPINEFNPDVVCIFQSKNSLETIINEMKKIQDGHVMWQTVRPIDQYTGERNYDL
jgi:hypothetical protein